MNITWYQWCLQIWRSRGLNFIVREWYNARVSYNADNISFNGVASLNSHSVQMKNSRVVWKEGIWYRREIWQKVHVYTVYDRACVEQTGRESSKRVAAYVSIDVLIQPLSFEYCIHISKVDLATEQIVRQHSQLIVWDVSVMIVRLPVGLIERDLTS